MRLVGFVVAVVAACGCSSSQDVVVARARHGAVKVVLRDHQTEGPRRCSGTIVEYARCLVTPVPTSHRVVLEVEQPANAERQRAEWVVSTGTGPFELALESTGERVAWRERTAGWSYAYIIGQEVLRLDPGPRAVANRAGLLWRHRLPPLGHRRGRRCQS